MSKEMVQICNTFPHSHLSFLLTLLNKIGENEQELSPVKDLVIDSY